MKRIFILMLFFYSITNFAQEVKLFGLPKPGNLLIGKSEKIKSIYLNKKKLHPDSAGYFVFGFDRDAHGKFVLRVNFTNGKFHREIFELEKEKYGVQKLTVARKFVRPPKKVLTQINEEKKMMKKARLKIGDENSALFASGFVYPVDSVKITGDFGNKRVLNGRPKNIHNGVDFGGRETDSVRAVADGIVKYVGDNFYYNGNFILIDHGQGLSTIYLHLSSSIVEEKQKVLKGEAIGFIGSTGRSTGPHLHLGVQWFEKRIDPMSLLEMNF